jgi:hypothetical protein
MPDIKTANQEKRKSMIIYTEYFQDEDRTILESDNLWISVQEDGWNYKHEKYRIRYVIKWKGQLTETGTDLFIPSPWSENMVEVLETLIAFMGNSEMDSDIWHEYNQAHKDALENGMYEEMQYCSIELQFAIENDRYYIEGIDD